MLATISTALLGLAQPANAITTLYGPDCPNITISDNIVLGGNLNNVTNPNGTCITIASGKDVDLSNRTISCSTGCSTKTAILATGSGTDVTGNPFYDLISGGWGVAIDGATTIDHVNISGALVGVKDSGDRLKTLSASVITCGGSGFCVDVTMPRSTDEITSVGIYHPFGSYPSGSGLRIVGASSGNGPTVSNSGVAYFSGTGIEQVGATKKVRMLNNDIIDCTAGGPWAGCTSPVPFDVDNAALATNLDVWRGNICTDDYFCPPAPSCGNFGTPVCSNGGVYCTP